MNKSIKSALLSFVAGIIAVLITGAFLKLVSLDMRWMSVVILSLSFLGSYIIKRKMGEEKRFLNGLLMTIPFALFFWMVIRPDLPSIWFIVPGVFIASMFGGMEALRSTKLPKWLFTNILVTIAIVLIIPMFISGDLMQKTNESGVAFELADHDGNLIRSQDLKGQVVVLDFYGTWCKPCIAELPELAKIKAHFEGTGQVKFLVVNSDQSGDTIEKARKFAKRFDYGFTYAYDHDRVVYKKLGLTSAGVPSLIMLDEEGNIRLRHVGYNKAETDFVENMIEQLNQIIQGE